MAISLVPGPTSVPRPVREAYLTDFGSADIESEFLTLYRDNVTHLQSLLRTNGEVVIMSGEGMVALWASLKSTVRSGDRVLCISGGVFGDGFVGMAKGLGAETMLLRGPLGDCPSDDDIAAAFTSFKPQLVTFVMCETPSGVIFDAKRIGELCLLHNALFLVDFVSAAAGVDVRVDDWHIDIGMLGSQKCLSCVPDLAVVTVSEKAWTLVQEVGYAGYDSILAFKGVQASGDFPYTMNWHAHAALNVSLKAIVSEGLDNVFRRHREVAEWTRQTAKTLGLRTFPAREELNSPTVTAMFVPDGWTWSAFDAELRAKGVVVGGSWGEFAGKLFRIGHMGNQARMELVQPAMAKIAEVLASKQL